MTGLVSFFNAGFITLILPETHHPGLIEKIRGNYFPVFGALMRGHTALYLWVALLVGLGAGVYRSSYSLYMDHFYGLTITQIGYLLMGVGVFMAFCQGYLLGKFWLKKFTPRKILTINLLSAIALFSTTALYDQFSAKYVLIWLVLEIVMVFFTVAMWPVLQSEGVSKASKDTRGEVSGYFSSVFSFTGIIAPILGGIMIEHSFSPMWIAALLSFVAFLMFYRYRESF